MFSETNILICIFIFLSNMAYTVGEIAKVLEGSVEGDSNMVIGGAAKIDEAIDGTISFITNPKYLPAIYQTNASAVIVSSSLSLEKEIPQTLVRVDNVLISMQKLLDLFSEEKNMRHWISTLASVSDRVKLGLNVNLGDFAYVGEGSSIGKDSYIAPQVFIGENVSIGENCKISAGVRIEKDSVIGNNVIIHPNAVIGSDGFGFVPDENGAFQKVKQAGNVIIEDDVEIGSNTVIDRATLGSTIIRKGVKLDNLIQIAHNVEIKKHTVIAAQAGVAGSTTVGAHSQIGGQVGIVGHLDLADGIKIQAQSGVASNIEKKNSKWYGSPAIGYLSYLRSFAIFKRLPELQKELARLKKQINQLLEKEEGQDI